MAGPFVVRQSPCVSSVPCLSIAPPGPESFVSDKRHGPMRARELEARPRHGAELQGRKYAAPDQKGPRYRARLIGERVEVIDELPQPPVIPAVERENQPMQMPQLALVALDL